MFPEIKRNKKIKNKVASTENLFYLKRTLQILLISHKYKNKVQKVQLIKTKNLILKTTRVK